MSGFLFVHKIQANFDRQFTLAEAQIFPQLSEYPQASFIDPLLICDYLSLVLYCLFAKSSQQTFDQQGLISYGTLLW